MIHQRILGTPKLLSEIKHPSFVVAPFVVFLNKDLRKKIHKSAEP